MNILGFEEMNPRYAEYCRAHSKSPIEMLYEDIFRYPGYRTIGFILWNQERVREFASQWKGCLCLADVQLVLRDQGYVPGDPKQDVQQLYNEWLSTRVTQELAA